MPKKQAKSPAEPITIDHEPMGTQDSGTINENHSQQVSTPPDDPGREFASRITTAEAAEMRLPGEFSPATVRAIRQKIAYSMSHLLPHAIEVVEGKRTWSAQQTQVFKTLLSKVAPDVEAKFVHHRHEHLSLNELSVEELARIASGEEP